MNANAQCWCQTNCFASPWSTGFIFSIDLNLKENLSGDEPLIDLVFKAFLYVSFCEKTV